MFRYLILGLLRTGPPLHGYALVKAYRDRSGVEVRTGNFYRELRRLLHEGLIACAAQARGMDERRMPYVITEAGRAAFEAWLTAPHAGQGEPADDDISARALFLGDSPPGEVAGILEHLRVNLWMWGKRLERERLAAMRQGAEAGPGSPAALLPLLLARRIKQVAADIELVEAVAELHAQRPVEAPRPAPALAVVPGPRAARRRD